MNQDNQISRENSVLELLRNSQDAAAKLDAEFVRLLNVNETDGRLLNLLQRHGTQTAGELATKSSLTTGAITTALDRLEKANYVRRVRDQKDRRKVFIELSEVSQKIGGRIFGPIGNATLAHLENYSEGELQTIEKFLRYFEHVNSTGAEILHDARTATPENKDNAANQFNAQFSKD
jgi:DNA-binding MarR family transcriptional regulator